MELNSRKNVQCFKTLAVFFLSNALHKYLTKSSHKAKLERESEKASKSMKVGADFYCLFANKTETEQRSIFPYIPIAYHHIIAFLFALIVVNFSLDRCVLCLSCRQPANWCSNCSLLCLGKCRNGIKESSKGEGELWGLACVFDDGSKKVWKIYDSQKLFESFKKMLKFVCRSPFFSPMHPQSYIFPFKRASAKIKASLCQ